MFFLGAAGGIQCYDRGDSASYDYQVGDFTQDGVWNDLDLSAIVGVGVSEVLIRFDAVTANAGRTIQLRTKGNSNMINVAKISAPVGAITTNLDLWVKTDSAGVIQYNIGASWFTIINCLVRKWLK